MQSRNILRFTLGLALLEMYFLSTGTTVLASRWWGFPPLFAIFASFVGCLLGWGSLAEKRWGGGWAGVFLFASVFAVAYAFVLGHLGLLHYRILFFAYLAMGGWWLSGSSLVEKIRSPELWVGGLFAFVFGLRYMAAFMPEKHGDPLLYHLVGPALWRMHGAVHIDPDLPNAILSATWEYLYLWPQAIWNQAASARELIVAQIFCQWLHLTFGWLGLAVVVTAAAKHVAMEDRWRFLFPLAALFVASLQWTASVAKNDAGVAFWCLGSWLFFEQALGSRRRALLVWSGVLAGLAVTAKISAILFLVPTIGITWLVALLLNQDLAEAMRTFGYFAVPFALALVPMYLRNWIEAGSPFFPMFQKYFPSPWVSASWEAHFSAVQPNEALSPTQMFMVRIREVMKEAVPILGWALIPVVAALAPLRRRVMAQRVWLIASAAAFLLFVFGFTQNAELRYLGASLVLLTMSGLLLLVSAFEQLLPSGKPRATAYWLLLIAVLAGSKLPTHLLWKMRKMPVGEAALLGHTAGDAKAWLRENTPRGALVVMVGDNESYYLLTVRTTVLTERPDLDRATRALKNLPAFVEAICRVSGGTYLLESRSVMGLQLRFPGEILNRAIAFQGAGDKVYDLRKLEQMVLEGKSQQCGRIPAPQFSMGAM